MDMRAYEVEMIRDGKVKYFFIRNMETMEIELLPTRFLTHKTRAQESPNTVGSLAIHLLLYELLRWQTNGIYRCLPDGL